MSFLNVEILDEETLCVEGWFACFCQEEEADIDAPEYVFSAFGGLEKVMCLACGYATENIRASVQNPRAFVAIS